MNYSDSIVNGSEPTGTCNHLALTTENITLHHNSNKEMKLILFIMQTEEPPASILGLKAFVKTN